MATSSEIFTGEDSENVFQVQYNRSWKAPLKNLNNYPKTSKNSPSTTYRLHIRGDTITATAEPPPGKRGTGVAGKNPSSVARRNARERRRIRNVNNAFDELRQHVPNGERNRKKISKVIASVAMQLVTIAPNHQVLRVVHNHQNLLLNAKLKRLRKMWWLSIRATALKIWNSKTVRFGHMLKTTICLSWCSWGADKKMIHPTKNAALNLRTSVVKLPTLLSFWINFVSQVLICTFFTFLSWYFLRSTHCNPLLNTSKPWKSLWGLDDQKPPKSETNKSKVKHATKNRNKIRTNPKNNKNPLRTRTISIKTLKTKTSFLSES